jgi:hypothetical protein
MASSVDLNVKNSKGSVELYKINTFQVIELFENKVINIK